MSITLNQQSPHNESAAGLHRPRILIADDEYRIRLALRACLESEGYLVDEAADGFDALDVIIRKAPDVMILDLAMPNLDGMRTLNELEAVHGQLKPAIIVLTAWGSYPAAVRAIASGASAFLEKPLVPEVLRSTVASVLARRAEMREEKGIPINWACRGVAQAELGKDFKGAQK